MPISLRVRRVPHEPPNESQDASASAPASDYAGVLTFDGPRVVIGRSSGSDVRLPDASVSHRHASVRVERSDFTLIDENSTNGTFVGGVRLSKGAPRILRTGDLVRVGRVWIEVSIDSGPPTRDLAGATRELALAMVAEAMAGTDEDKLPRVHVVEGADRGLQMALIEDGQNYICGRGESCDLPLADQDASREHVAIFRRGNTVFLRDLGSKNGALLGSETLPRERDVAWKASLALSLGRTVLALQEPVASQLALLEAADDASLGEAYAPVPPPPPSRNDTHADAAPESVTGDAAPIAEVPSKSVAGATTVSTKKPKRQRRRSGWSVADVIVMIAAIVVLLLSVAGMAWLLK